MEVESDFHRYVENTEDPTFGWFLLAMAEKISNKATQHPESKRLLIGK